MGVTSAVQWWGEWQLHVLAFGSLGIQYLLTFSAGLRNAPISQWFRFFIWLCYLGSDAVAVYALATLFNRQKNQQIQSSTHGLQVLWAPILLMHLGGQAVITAYNIEDNELWRRHVVTALSQVTVVLWVLYKSWGSSPLGTKSFQVAAVLLFITGILKCLEKPWALKSASFHSLANSCGPAKRSASREDELQKYVEQARAFFLRQENNYSSHTTELYAPEMLFIDFTYPYCDRLANLRSYFLREDEKAYNSLQDGIVDIYKVLYTKKKMTSCKDDPDEEVSCRGCFAGVTRIFSLLLLATSHFLILGNDQNDKIEHPATVLLLFFTGALEYLAPKIMDCFYENTWPATIAQHNVIGYFARNRRHTMLMSFARFFQCKGLLDQCWSMESRYSAVEITKLVRQHVRDGWMEYIKDVESYREFNDMRGQWTLVRESCDQSLGWSLEKPFDESILLWHMATDFCLHHMGTPPGHERVSRSTEISNYMMHLLFRNPDMLMAGSRTNLVKTAYDELKKILKGEEASSCKEEAELSRKISDKLKSNEVATESFIYDAWVLAERLMDLGDETKMWKVIQGVWLEMLCFSAGRCRGYLHAKSLGSGGEYLSFVWLLLAHTGMETFSERIQRSMPIHLLRHKREQELQSTRTLPTSRDFFLDRDFRNFGETRFSR